VPAVTAQPTDAPPRIHSELARFTVATIAVVTVVVGWLVVVARAGRPGHHRGPEIAALFVWALFVWICAPLVSYRRRDIAFGLLCTPIGMAWLTGKIVYRLMLLPYRDWNPRPDEPAVWTRIPDPNRPGRMLFPAAGRAERRILRSNSSTRAPGDGPPPAGWYDDPYEPGLQRYHSGSGWTDQIRSHV
jgi:hypothetical protein